MFDDISVIPVLVHNSLVGWFIGGLSPDNAISVIFVTVKMCSRPEEKGLVIRIVIEEKHVSIIL